MAQRYHYNRIDLATDAIRLVRLPKGDKIEPIRCQMFESYLHQAEGIPYEALSYVWGNRQSADMIWLDGYHFEVTKNLYEALVHLRRQDEDRVLWIDAICIDQNHNAVSDHILGLHANIHSLIIFFWNFPTLPLQFLALMLKLTTQRLLTELCRKEAIKSARCAWYMRMPKGL